MFPEYFPFTNFINHNFFFYSEWEPPVEVRTYKQPVVHEICSPAPVIAPRRGATTVRKPRDNPG